MGQISVSGGPDLKASQHYPVLFGQAVAELVVAQEAAIIEGMFGGYNGLNAAAIRAGSNQEGGQSTEDCPDAS